MAEIELAGQIRSKGEAIASMRTVVQGFDVCCLRASAFGSHTTC